MPIDTVKRIHSAVWKPKQSVSLATITAGEITRQWQAAVTKSHKGFRAEYPVEGLREKIDLVDITRMIAYELKVSPNNTHMEFYRDLFKVMAHNELAAKPISKLVFIAPGAGARRLQRGLGEVACRLSKKFGFSVEVVEIP
jgi:hypothetical protein